jgi:hypothetical protein
MNYRLQVVPLSSAADPRNTCTLQEIQIFRSWLACDFESELIGRQRLNWNALLGLFFAVGVSVGVWTAAGLLAARFWR